MSGEHSPDEVEQLENVVRQWESYINYIYQELVEMNSKISTIEHQLKYNHPNNERLSQIMETFFENRKYILHHQHNEDGWVHYPNHSKFNDDAELHRQEVLEE